MWIPHSRHNAKNIHYSISSDGGKLSIGLFTFFPPGSLDTVLSEIYKQSRENRWLASDLVRQRQVIDCFIYTLSESRYELKLLIIWITTLKDFTAMPGMSNPSIDFFRPRQITDQLIGVRSEIDRETPRTPITWISDFWSKLSVQNCK